MCSSSYLFIHLFIFCLFVYLCIYLYICFFVYLFLCLVVYLLSCLCGHTVIFLILYYIVLFGMCYLLFGTYYLVAAAVSRYVLHRLWYLICVLFVCVTCEVPPGASPRGRDGPRDFPLAYAAPFRPSEYSR